MKDLSSLKKLPHFPVMLREVLEVCDPKKGGSYIDCTFGLGSYSNSILSFPNTNVIAFDRDPSTKKYASPLMKKYPDRFTFFNKKFSKLDEVVKKENKVDFIIFDLGLSSLQLKNLSRGFSFKSKGKADMRMGLNKFSAHEVINKLDFNDLARVLKIFGEEKDSRRIARNVVNQRKKKIISSIPQLIEIVKYSKKKDLKKGTNISTKTFQAIRILVNNEITELVNGLIKATKLLKTGGKILVITFHSIEDRIVKFFFSNYSKNKSRGSRYLPDLKNSKILFENYSNKIITPTKNEIEINNPSRSAKMRFAVRSEDEFFTPVDFKKNFNHYLDLESSYV